MKYFTKGLLILLVALMVAIPAGAVTVGTGVNIQSGGGSIPVILAKWEQDTTASLEDGDPTHANAGAQFLPPCTFGGIKPVDYFAVVFDEEDNGNVKLVFADVYHPDGTFKYQVNFEQMTKADGIAAFNTAVAAGLMKLPDGTSAADVLFELEKGTAAVWTYEANLHYCQMDGIYTVNVQGIDQNDNYSAIFSNTFLYVPVACAEFDFTAVNYGSVSISRNVWRAGDTIFDPNVGLTPTVRNIGNTKVKITIQQDDMGFGQDYDGDWMVNYDARLGNTGAEPVYMPNEKITLPDVLDRSHLEELDFSIHVLKGTGSHAGSMTLGVVNAADN